MYDPTIGRWMSEDPLGFTAGDPNLYRYVGNGPTNYTDPSGLEPIGHHWVPVSVILDYWDLLTQAAQQAIAGDASGPMGGHNYGPSGGVPHSDYNEIVREELEAFIKEKKFSKSNQIKDKEILEFARRMREGESYLKGGRGKANSAALKKFNREVLRRAKQCGTKQITDPRLIKERGKQYIKNSNRFLAIAAIGGILDLLAQGGATIDQLNKLAGSPKFQEALRAAEEGNLARVQQLLVGNVAGDGAFDPSHLFGELAKDLLNANHMTTLTVAELHGRLLAYFAKLSRTCLTPPTVTGK